MTKKKEICETITTIVSRRPYSNRYEIYALLQLCGIFINIKQFSKCLSKCVKQNKIYSKSKPPLTCGGLPHYVTAKDLPCDTDSATG